MPGTLLVAGEGVVAEPNFSDAGKRDAKLEIAVRR